jgi:hypothetical protein
MLFFAPCCLTPLVASAHTIGSDGNESVSVMDFEAVEPRLKFWSFPDHSFRKNTKLSPLPSHEPKNYAMEVYREREGRAVCMLLGLGIIFRSSICQIWLKYIWLS